MFVLNIQVLWQFCLSKTTVTFSFYSLAAREHKYITGNVLMFPLYSGIWTHVHVTQTCEKSMCCWFTFYEIKYVSTASVYLSYKNRQHLYPAQDTGQFPTDFCPVIILVKKSFSSSHTVIQLQVTCSFFYWAACLFLNRFVSIFFSVCLWVPRPLRVSFSPVTGHWGEEQKGWTILETPHIIHTRCSLAGRLTFVTWGLEGELRDPSALDESPWSLLGLTGESYSCLSEGFLHSSSTSPKSGHFLVSKYEGTLNKSCPEYFCLVSVSVAFFFAIVYRYLFYIMKYDIYRESKKWSHSVMSNCSMDCSLPASSIHGIFLARVLEWVAISFSRGSSWPRDQTQVSHIVGRCFTVWATREASIYISEVYTENLTVNIHTLNCSMDHQ